MGTWTQNTGTGHLHTGKCTIDQDKEILYA